MFVAVGDDWEVQLHDPGYHHGRFPVLYLDPCPNSNPNPGRHVFHCPVDLREQNARISAATVRQLVPIRASPGVLDLDSEWHRFDGVDARLHDAPQVRETTFVVTGRVMLPVSGKLEVEQAGEHLGLFSFLASSGTPFGGATTVAVMTKESRAAFLQKVYSAGTSSD